jgi:single-strand DNA-binding protein
LLVRSGGSGAGGGDFGTDDTGDFGSPGPSRKVAAAGVGARNGSPRADMDDEIPF